MASKLARLAIPRLHIEPHHHILEIGCGGGTAVGEVARRLTTGSILAIDRSRAQVARASRRNAEHIARGVARIVHVDLSDLIVESRRFDTIFALNVHLFPAAHPSTVEVVRKALRRRGRLVLGYERHDSRQLAARAELIRDALCAGGLGEPTVDWASPTHVYLTATRR